jgi:subtilisin family serine protease
VERRLLAVGLLALCFAAAAAAAPAVTATDPLQSQEWWLADVGADRATPPGPGVPVTIVDTGVDPTHPEFAARPDTTFLNAQTVFAGEEYHGTIVASLAAAPANGAGIVGIYPTAALQVWDASSSSRGIANTLAIDGIIAAAGRCPGVINLSFGSATPDPDLHDAILYAVRNGCLVVVSSGNFGDAGNPATYPAAWPHVFTVGATDESDQVASFSSTGQDVDMVAPGVRMVGAVPLSRDPSGYSSNLAGTSFSSPIVAAAAAWVWTARPTLSVTQIAELLRKSARDILTPGFDNASGWGILDIPAALVAPTPAHDPAEPNDDVEQVKPGKLFQAGQAPLTTPAKPAIRAAGSVDVTEDPRDLYRMWVPANKVVRVAVSAGGRAAARIWGPQTVSVNEGIASRRRDLRGTSVKGGKNGFAAYVEVLLTGRASHADYILSITAAKR